jgi:putative restriction endonuclease
MRFARSRRAYTPSIVPRCRPDRLRRSLCDFSVTGTQLLDAAHIVMHADEQLGQPIISNGLPLTKIHHATFDANLIGIDPDFRIHVSDRLLEIHDGPFLELGLKGIAGALIDRPIRSEDRPDRDRLAIRFELFMKAA